MKPSSTAFILLVAACAASGFAGYYFGRQNSANTAATAAAGKHTGASGGKSSIVLSDTTDGVTLASLLKGPGLPDADLLSLWAKTLSPKDCADMMKQLQAGKGGLLRDTVLEAVLKSWAKSDPQGLLGSAAQLKSPHLRESGMDVALKTWAAKDPAAALQWLKDNPGTASTAATQARFNAAIAGIASTDPKSAFAAITALGEGNERDKQNKSEALHALTDALAQSGHIADAQQLIATLPAGASRDDAFDHLAESFAAASPEDATAWAANITDPAERQRIEGHVVDAWAASDPLAAASWAAQIDQQSVAAADPNAPADPLNGPGMLLANAILSWAQDDLDGPGQFLNQLPDSPNKDRAVAIFAMHVGQEDPESAAKWLGTVSDPKIRDGVTMVVALQMYQQDPATFTNFMSNNSQMSDTQKQSLTQMVPMLGASMAVLKGMSGKGGDPMSNIMEGVLTGKSSPLNAMIRARAGQPGAAGANPFAPGTRGPAATGP